MSESISAVTEYVEIQPVSGNENISAVVEYTGAFFKITSYSSQVSGRIGEQKTINVTIENQGNADGDCMVRVKDNNGNVVASDTKTISAGGSATYNLNITLPSQAGTYTWTIEAYNVNTGSVDDSKTFTVQVSTTTRKKSEFPWWILLLFGIGAVMYLSGKEEKK